MELKVKPDEISEILKKQLKDFTTAVREYEVGTVLQVGDGIARVHGLSEVMAGELVAFENDLVGIALNLEEDNVGVTLFGEDTHIKEGDLVKRTGKIAQIPVGEALLGRVIDATGTPPTRPIRLPFRYPRGARHPGRYPSAGRWFRPAARMP